MSKNSALIGADSFPPLVNGLAEMLTADCVYLGEFVGGQDERVRTLAACVGGGQVARSGYVLAGSLAARVSTGEPCSYARGVQKHFPSDALLQECGASAGVAAPLLNSNQQVLGVLMALYRRALGNIQLPLSMLETYTPSAAALLGRRQGAAALRESEQRYHAFISRNPDAMWRIEFETPIPTNLPENVQVEQICASGYLAECNQSMARLIGCSRAEQLIGLGFAGLVKRVPSFRELIRCAIRSGYRFAAGEVGHLDRAGNVRILRQSHWGIVENGMLERIWGTLRDVTKLKRLKVALHASEQRFMMLESTHVFTSKGEYFDGGIHIGRGQRNIDRSRCRRRRRHSFDNLPEASDGSK